MAQKNDFNDVKCLEFWDKWSYTHIIAFFRMGIRREGLKYAKYLQMTLKHINFRNMEIFHLKRTGTFETNEAFEQKR